MGREIIKINEEEDFYVVWSSIVESPVMWGTRAETVEYLLEVDERKPEFALPSIEVALERADEHGSSSRLGTEWDDYGVIFEQKGWVLRSRLVDFLNSYDEETRSFDLSLLEPFEDEGR